jgi:dipeptidyl aminopeptidase/acylaminoacyl peptidase
MTDIVLYGGLENFHDRSPIHFADRIKAPLIIFQGLDDAIVPPNQAELMIEVLRRNRVPFAYVAFEGEGHGFRKPENLARAAEAELYFYSRVFGFDLAERVQPVEIENL